MFISICGLKTPLIFTFTDIEYFAGVGSTVLIYVINTHADIPF